MKIPKNNDWIINQSDISDLIDAIISKFLDHSSIRNINITINTFNFKLSDLDEIKKEVLNLKTNVSCPLGSVPSSLLKDNIDVSSEFLLNIINFGISNSTFDDGMKSAIFTPIFKRDEPIFKENYRPISWV